MKFKYNGRIYNPVDTEKKLKKLGITIEDIEIIPEEKPIEEKIEDLGKRKVCILNTIDNSKRIAFVPKDEPNPEIEKLLERFKWNPTTKTGIREITPDYIKTMYYEE